MTLDDLDLQRAVELANEGRRLVSQLRVAKAVRLIDTPRPAVDLAPTAATHGPGDDHGP